MIVEALGRQGLASRDDGSGQDGAQPSAAAANGAAGAPSVRVIIEKPFGTSLAEAMDLNRRDAVKFGQ